ncbi:MAG: glycoside hydrolase family 95 protein [Terrimicrobiaceae bacterium]
MLLIKSPSALTSLALLTLGLSSAFAEPLTLWYDRPAAQWVEALPLGNGHLGAMVFGGIDQERLQLNEDTLWAGGPYDPVNPKALESLPEVRRLIAEGKLAEAQKLTDDNILGTPNNQAPYQTVGDLIITTTGGDVVTDYRRELDLDTAIAKTSYSRGLSNFTRETFSSPVDQVIVTRITQKEKSGACRLGFTVALQTPQNAQVRTLDNRTLVMAGTNGDAKGSSGSKDIKGALKFEVRVQVIVERGRVTADGSQLHVSGTDSAIVLVAISTSYKRFDDVSGDPAALNTAVIAAAAAKPYDTLRAAHVAEHQRLFNRVSLDLGTSDAAKLPTDQRVRDFATGNDPALAALYFQFGRYLLISSSRPGTQPANLQGIWNDSMSPPWGSKYTININTEMNYWPAESANLAECAEPLFNMIDDLAITGARTAQSQYGAGGWVVHHNTDLWRATAPIDGARFGMWPTGGAWLCMHLWEHYLYSGDKAFLARAYPRMKGAAQFFLETLVTEPNHNWLVTSPSISPENRHSNGIAITAGPTMDQQIIRDLFGACIESSSILGLDADFRAKLIAARAQLAPNQIGAQGQLQEWLEDWDARAPEQNHRHVSHLYGFFPSAQITLRGNPELAKAVRKTLETRGDKATGWAIAWRFNLWARLQDGERAYAILKLLLTPSFTYPNLFDAHPPFQIDGNFGAVSGMIELLLQSHAGEIELLPALPKAWPTGSVTGLRARGGLTVDIAWKDGVLTRARFISNSDQTVTLRLRDTTKKVQLSAGNAFEWDGR